MSAEDLRAQAENDGRDAISRAMEREEVIFGSGLVQAQATARYVGAKAAFWSALALLLIVAALCLPFVLWALL
jgi:hypothetical protein